MQTPSQHDDDDFFYPSQQRQIPKKLWQDLEEIVKRCVDEKFSRAHHQFEGDLKLVFSSLFNIQREEPFLEQSGSLYDYVLATGKMTLGEINTYDPVTDCTRPLYTYEAEYKKYNYAANVIVDFVFKVMSKHEYVIISNTMSNQLQSYLLNHENGNNASPTPKSNDQILASLANLFNENDAMASVDIDEEAQSFENRENNQFSLEKPLCRHANLLRIDHYHKYKHIFTNTRASNDKNEFSFSAKEAEYLDIEKDIRVGKTCKIVEDIIAFKDNVGQIFIMVNGENCNIKLSGGYFCHSDPDDIGAYYIVKGGRKTLESQFSIRGNHSYVHFQKSSTSHSQSATVSEASNTENNSTADSPIILACDYRPVHETLFRYTAACHFFLVVNDGKIARKELERKISLASVDSESFQYESSPNVSPDSIINHTVNHNNTRTYTGFGENITISYPNIKQSNFNLICILFLMGCNSRHEMIKLIANQEMDQLISEGMLNIENGVLSDPHLLVQKDNYTRQCYLFYNEVYSIIHNQSIFPYNDVGDLNPDAYNESEYNTLAGQLRNIISKDYMPLIGHQDMNIVTGEPIKEYQDIRSTNAEKLYSNENAWKKPLNFDEIYNNASLDGWDRTSVLCHIAFILSKQKKGFKKSDIETHCDFKSKTFSNELKKLVASLKRFCKSFIEEFLPHIGKSAHWRIASSKLTIMSMIIRKMIHVYLGYLPPDNVDDFNIKRVDLASVHIITEAYRNSYTNGFHKLMKYAVNAIEKNVLCPTKLTYFGLPMPNVSKVNWSHFTNVSFNQCPFAEPMLKGVISKQSSSVMDVSGSVKRHLHANNVTRDEATRHVRLVRNSNGGKRMKGSAAQQLNNSHMYSICPARTGNDNESGNDVKLSRACKIRVGYESSNLVSVIIRGAEERCDSKHFNHIERTHSFLDCNFFELSFPHCPKDAVLVLVNGINVGFTRRPFETMKALKYTRECGSAGIPFDVSITWVNGPIGDNENNPLINPMFNYIHVSGDPGSTLTPFINMSNIWKMPMIVSKFSSSRGVYPNVDILPLALNFSHLSKSVFDKKSGLSDFPFHACNIQGVSPLFDALLQEGIIVYRDCEEMKQEILCPSMRDFEKNCDYFMSKSHMNYVKQIMIDKDRKEMRFKDFIEKHGAPAYIDVLKNTFSVSSIKRNSFDFPGCDLDCTMMVISEEFMLGLTASMGPFSNSVDPCRVNYSAGMFSQSTSSLPLNHKYLKNHYSMSLVTPKMSLSPSSISKNISVCGTASASLPTLTVFLSNAHNGEDAVGRSRSSFGSFDVRHDVFYTTSGLLLPDDEYEKVVAHDKDKLLAPESIPTNSHCYISPSKTRKCVTLKSPDFSNVDSNGMPKIGATYRPNAAVIGKVLSVGNKHFFRDSSLINSSRMSLIAQSFVRTKTSSGSASEISVKLSCTRVPEKGDKMSDYHGQKGVNGEIEERCNSPYILSKGFRAIIPSLERGSHSVASRGTPGEHRECAHAHKCLKQGRILEVSQFCRDFEPFGDNDPNTCEKDDSFNMSAHSKSFGSFVMINAEDGTQLKSLIAGGYLDYRLMHHLSRETFNSRKLGAVDPRTRQPTEGTKKHGGGRSGTLESFNLISQGVPDVMEQLHFSGSDPGFVNICSHCGLLADYAPPSIMSRLISSVKDYVQKKKSKIDRNKPNSHGMEKKLKILEGFMRLCMISENGPTVLSNQKKEANDLLMICRDSNGLVGNLMSSTGGYCASCKRFDTVWQIRMPLILPQLMENFHMTGLAWRMLSNQDCLKGDFSSKNGSCEVQLSKLFDTVSL